MTAELLEQLVAALAEKLAPLVAAELASNAPAQAPEPSWAGLVDVDEAGRLLGRSPRWLRDRVKRRELPAVRFDGGKLGFERDDLRAFAERYRMPRGRFGDVEERRLRAVDDLLDNAR